MHLNESNENMQPITIQFAVRVGLYLYFYIILSASCRHYWSGRIMDYMTQVTHLPSVSYFTSEWLIIAHGKKGPTTLSVSSERNWQKGVKEIAKVSKQLQRDSNRWTLDCQLRTLTAELHRLNKKYCLFPVTRPTLILTCRYFFYFIIIIIFFF